MPVALESTVYLADRLAKVALLHPRRAVNVRLPVPERGRPSDLLVVCNLIRVVDQSVIVVEIPRRVAVVVAPRELNVAPTVVELIRSVTGRSVVVWAVRVLAPKFPDKLEPARLLDDVREEHCELAIGPNGAT